MANPLLVFEGDSLTQGQTADLGYEYPTQVNNRLVSPVSFHNVGVSGSTMVTVNGRAATVDGFIAAGQAWRIEFLWIGTNDLCTSLRTPAQVYSDITTYCAARRTAGYQVVIFTLTPRSNVTTTAGYETDRQTLNANIRANWATFADYLIDVGNDPTLGPAGAELNTAYYNDKLHLTDRGYDLVAGMARAALQNLQPGTAMAISPNTAWEVRASGASDNNGGGFVGGSGGTDYSQQNAAQLSLTDLATSGVVTTLTSVTGGFTAAMVGNLIQITSGTNFTPGFYQVTVFTNSNTVTLDRAPSTAAGSAGVGALGGALLTLAKIAAAMVAGNKAYLTGAFTTAATVTVAAGTAPTGATGYTRLIGYGSARGDSGHATVTLQTNTGLTGITQSAGGFGVEQIDVNCASLGTSIGINLAGTDSFARACKVSNFTSSGILMNSLRQVVSGCELTGGGAAASAAIFHQSSIGLAAQNYIHDNACRGIFALSGLKMLANLIVNNTGASSDGIAATNGTVILNNTIHGSGRDGIRNTGALYGGIEWLNNLLTNNTGWGITGSTGAGLPAAPEYDGNAYFSNTLGNRTLLDSTTGIYGVNPYTNVRDVVLSASPYVGPTSGSTANFGLNATAGGGAACRGTGQPGSWLGNTGSAGLLDLGAVQHAGGGSPGIIMPV